MLENINSKIEYITPWAASIVWWGLQLSTLDILNTAQCPMPIPTPQLNTPSTLPAHTDQPDVGQMFLSPNI